MTQASIVVIGSANADLVLNVEARPEPGETVLGSDLVTSPGGKGANQAVAAGLLGAAVSFVGAVGQDADGTMLLDSLRQAGVDITHVLRAEVSSGHAIIVVTPDGENTIIVSSGANRLVDEEHLTRAAEQLGQASVVVVQLEIPMPAVERSAVLAREAGARFILNAAPAAALPQPVLEAADPLVVNESEAAMLLQGSESQAVAKPEAVCAALLARGARSLVLTLGAHGAWYQEAGGEIGHVPAHDVPTIDTTGAGDAFVGALATSLAQHPSLAAAVEYATSVAAHAVTRPGAQPSYPTAAELGASFSG